MHFFLSIAMGLALAFLGQALPHSSHSRAFSRRSTVAANAIPIEDFLLSKFNETSVANATSQSFKRYMSFIFADPNSNTSTTCSSNWTDTANSTGAPSQYILCNPTKGTPKPEFFVWYITSYTSPRQFSVQLAHEFSDPKY